MRESLFFCMVNGLVIFLCCFKLVFKNEISYGSCILNDVVVNFFGVYVM